jgi:hypothetical protein
VKSIDFSNTVQIVANIGVIAGIVFLALELRQNNELMATEGRFNRVSLVAQQFRTLAEDPDLTELRVRAAKGEPLSDVEQRRIEGALMATFLILQWEFGEFSEDSPEVANIREVQVRNFSTDASYRRFWNDRKEVFSPEFVRWMDEQVVSAAH